MFFSWRGDVVDGWLCRDSGDASEGAANNGTVGFRIVSFPAQSRAMQGGRVGRRGWRTDGVKITIYPADTLTKATSVMLAL